jgi:hypothetical protein
MLRICTRKYWELFRYLQMMSGPNWILFLPSFSFFSPSIYVDGHCYQSVSISNRCSGSVDIQYWWCITNGKNVMRKGWWYRYVCMSCTHGCTGEMSHTHARTSRRQCLISRTHLNVSASTSCNDTHTPLAMLSGNNWSHLDNPTPSTTKATSLLALSV